MTGRRSRRRRRRRGARRRGVRAARTACARGRSRSGLLALAASFVLPRQALIGNEIAILALFALSLDLILGYAGIVSLGHAAFFGTGAYAAGLFAKHVMPRSARRACRRPRRRRAARVRDELPRAARHRPDAPDGHARRRADPATSSPTSGVDHRRRRRLAGRRRWSRCSACSRSTSSGAPRTRTASPSCSCCSWSRGGSSIRRSACR